MANKDFDLILSNIRKKYEGSNVKTNKQKEKDDLNWWESFGAGMLSGSRSIQKGILGGFEDLLDLGTGIASGVGSLFGADTSKIDEFTKRNLAEEYMNSEFQKGFEKYTQGYWMFGDKALEQGQSGEYLPSIVDEVLQTTGNMLTLAAGATGGAKAGASIAKGLGASTKTIQTAGKVGQFLGTMTTASGGGVEQALNEDATIGQSLGYGLTSGAVEAVSEAVVGKALGAVSSKVFGGTNLGGKIAGIVGNSKVGSVGKSNLGTALVRIVQDFGEEGLEEVFSDLVNPLAQMATYKQDSTYQEIFQENGGVQGLVESFLMGGFMGGMMSGGSTIAGTIQYKGLANYNLATEIEGIMQTNQELRLAYMDGDTARVDELSQQKAKQVERIEKHFNETIEKLKDNKITNKNLTTLMLGQQATEEINRDYRTDVAKNVLGKNVEVGIDDSAKGSYVNVNTGKVSFKSKQITTKEAVDTIIHEGGHIWTSKELRDEILKNVPAEELKNKINEYESKYRSEILNSKLVEDEMKKKGISKTQAYNNVKEEYIREEISNDVLASYFKNLNEWQNTIDSLDKKGLGRLVSGLRKRFLNKNKPENFQKIMQMIKKAQGEADTKYQRVRKEESKTQKKTDNKYKLEDSLNTLKSLTNKELHDLERTNGKYTIMLKYKDIKNWLIKAFRGELENIPNKIIIGKVSDETASLVEEKTSRDIKNKNILLDKSDIRHIYIEHSQNSKREIERGQIPINETNLENIIETIIEPTDVENGVNNTVIFKKEINGLNFAIAFISNKKNTLSLKTAYIRKVTPPSNAKALDITSETVRGITSNENIPQKEKEVKYKLDSQGNALNEEQQKFFKDSQVRDENGNLQVVYHSSNADFNIFDKAKKGSNTGWLDTGLGFYFSPNEEITKQFGTKTKAYYLNIKKPLDLREFYSIAGFEESELNKKQLKLVNDIAKIFSVSQQEVLENSDEIIFSLDDFEGELADNIDVIQELGYDGVIKWIDRKNNIPEYVAFEPNQIKSIDNKNPSLSEDVRFKLDSEGNELSETKSEFYKDSEMRDKKGYLLTLYHGTGKNFTIFGETKDKTIHFLTTDKNTAKNYGSNIMKVYVNAENVLRIDAKNSSWEAIDFNIGRKKLKLINRNGLKFESQKDIEKLIDYYELDDINELDNRTYYTNYYSKKGFNNFTNINSLLKSDKTTIFDLARMVEFALDKNSNLDEFLNDFDIYDIDGVLDIIFQAFEYNNKEEFLRDYGKSLIPVFNDEIETRILESTRTITEWAKEQGYDGVIFENIYDLSSKPVTVVATLKSPNQIKNVDNEQPTKDADIRYKLDDEFLENIRKENLESVTIENNGRKVYRDNTYMNSIVEVKNNKGEPIFKGRLSYLSNDYNFKKVDLHKLVEDTKVLDNKGVEQRRTNIWGVDKSKYVFDSLEERTTNNPIRLVIDESGKYRIEDGNHRIIALLNEGFDDAYLLVKKTEKNDVRYKLDEVDPNTEKNRERLLKRIGRIDQYADNPSVYEAYKTMEEYIKQLESISGLDLLNNNRILAKYEKAYKEGKALEDDEIVEQPKEVVKEQPKEPEVSQEEIERQQALDIIEKNKPIVEEVKGLSKQVGELYQSLKKKSLNEQIKGLKQLQTLREDAIKKYEQYKTSFGGNKSGVSLSAIEDLGVYIYARLNEDNEVNSIEGKIDNIEKSILEKQIKPKTEKKVDIKETKVVTKLIKSVRTLVNIDSAETIILRATIKNEQIYRKERANDLLQLVNSAFERGRGDKFRLRFDKGYELAQNRIFEVLNSSKYTKEQKADLIRDIILEGVEVKALDYDPDTLMSRGRKVFTPINAWNIDEKIRSNLYRKLDGMIKGVITIGGEPSELTKRVQKISQDYATTNERLTKELDNAIEENTRLSKELNEEKKALKEIKTEDKILKKQIERLNSKLEKAQNSLNTAFIKEGNRITTIKNKNAEISQLLSEYKQDIKSLTSKLKTTTTRLAKAESDLYGNVRVDSTIRNNIETIISESLGKYSINENTYLKFARLVSKGDVTSAVELLWEDLSNTEFNVGEINFKLNELSKEDIDYIHNELNQSVSDYLSKADISKFQELKNKLSRIKQFYRENIEIERSVVSLVKSSKSLNEKVKTKQSGVSPVVATQIQGLVGSFTKVSKASLMNGSFRQNLKDFIEHYYNINNANINGAELPDFIVDMIEDVANIDQDQELSIAELKQYKEIIKSISKFIKNASGDITYNIDGKNVTIKEISSKGINQQKTLKEKIKYGWRKIWNFVTPRLVFEGIDEYQNDGVFSQLFRNLQKGELKFQENYLDLVKPFDEFRKNNRAFMKSLNDKVEIGKFKGTKAQALYIYLLSQDSDGYQHMMHSGLQVEKGQAITFVKEEIVEPMLDDNGKPILKKSGKNKGQPKTTTRYESAELDKFINDIYKTLNLDSEVSKEYIEITQNFFDNKSRLLKYETDLELYSVSNVKDKNQHYIPIRVSGLDLNTKLDEKTFNTKGMQGVLNYGFNKNRTSNLGKISVQNINELVYSHARSVAQYSGYAVPINALNQAYNYRNENGESLGSIAKERLGAEKNTYYLDDYINGLLRSWQGISGGKTMFNKKINSLIGNLRGKFAKFQLGFNFKVILSQISSMPASLRYITIKNLTFANKLKMKDLPPIPALAEYRKHDNSVAQAQALTAIGKATSKFDKIADKMSIGITWMDSKVMNQIWKASLLQTKKADGSWNVVAATELFNKTATETQPMYNALERSTLQRTDNEIFKSLLMFTAQPLQNLSNLIEIGARARARARMGQKLSSEEKKLAVNSIVAIASQCALYTAITMIFKYLLDKDDKPEDALDWVVQYVNDNVLGMIPLINNLSLDLDDRELIPFITRNEFKISWLEQFNTAIETLGDVTDSSLTPHKRIKGFADTIGMITGIPTRNIYNYTIGLVKQWIEPVYEFDANVSGNIKSKTPINKALELDNTKKSKAYFKAYNKNILDLNDNTLEAMFELYKENKSSALKAIPSTFTVDEELIEVDQVKFKNTYSKVEKQLNVVNLGVFKRSSDTTKEYVVNKLVNTYYNLARKEQTNEALNKFELIATTSFDLGKNLIYLSEIENIKATKTKTRKQLVEAYINKLPIKADMKYLLFALAGYSIPETKKASLKSLLRFYGMNTKNITTFLS